MRFFIIRLLDSCCNSLILAGSYIAKHGKFSECNFPFCLAYKPRFDFTNTRVTQVGI